MPMKANTPEWRPSDELVQLEARVFPDGFTLRDEANAIVAMAFRNGPIEDLHAGKLSDLLSNPDLSRITDDEMKTLMINACEQVAKLLELKDTEGDQLFARVISVGKSRVKLDFNHPLAGKELSFKVTILGLRAATPEELEHGHVHGSEGHAH